MQLEIHPRSAGALAGFMLALVAAGSVPASAQAPLLRLGPPGPRAERWMERLEADGSEVLDPAMRAREAAPAGAVAPSELDAIEEVEALLMRSRAARAQLREGEAMRALSRAQSLVEAHLAVPGIAAWYAEVQLAIAITAAQVGERGLSEAALRRAASVDPSRRVQAAEARPEVVALAARVQQGRASAPHGRFRVDADAEGATLSVDDDPVGGLPRVVELDVGTHLVRVDAPGFASWAAVLEVREGERPAVHVSLSPGRGLVAARRVEAAAREGDRTAIVAALSELPEIGDVRLLMVGGGDRDRALTLDCGPDGCARLARLDADAWPDTSRAALSDAELRAARAWLDEPFTTAPDAMWWERWETWLGVGGALVLVGAAISVGLAVDYAQRAPNVVPTVEYGDFVRQ
ncbi:MAG: PEGA domain-containing protein [Sandaracinaceae bacterium]